MTTLVWAAGVIVAGGASAQLIRRTGVADRVFASLVGFGCILGAIPALRVLTGSEARDVSLWATLPGGPWVFGLDALSGWFVLAILMVGAAAAVFGVSYLAPERGHRPVGLAHPLVAVLLVALLGVVTARAVVPFLVSWEVMALSAYLLVMHERERPEIRRAGLIYLLLTHLSTLALIGMFAALAAGTAEPTFAAMLAGDGPTGPARALALTFGLVGFGIKAGVVPMHFWLPGAHAAAPSHVSALLSGVMLKTGVYGLLRLISFLRAPPLWLGWTLLALGLVSGVLGVLWALRQHDLKRLLAYHSVENIGIILMGLGLGTLGLAYHRPAAAMLGFIGAVLHTLNHALFKSLLFLGAGAILRAAGSRTIDHLGGLGRRMPLTALAFGIGSVAIVGLPPLNGFVSEWLLAGGLLEAGHGSEALRFSAFGVAGLGVIGGLALACFAKLVGVMFLGQARTAAGAEARDPGAGMIGPQLGLAAACVAIGVAPVLVIGPAGRVAAEVIRGDFAGPVAGWAEAAGQVSALAVGLVGVVALLAVLRYRLRRTAAPAAVDTWACGGQPLTPRMQYSASSFAGPLLATFAPLAGTGPHPGHGGIGLDSGDLVEARVVLPAWRWLQGLSRRVRQWQGTRIRWYLLWVIATLVALLVRLAGWTGTP